MRRVALDLKKTDLLRSRWSSVHLKGATGWKVDGLKTMLPPFHLERNVDVATHAHSQRDPSPTPYISLLAPIASVAPPPTVTVAVAIRPIASMEPPLPSPLLLRSVLIVSMVPPPLYPLPIGARTYCQLPVWHLPLHRPINSAAPALLSLLQCAFIASMGPPPPLPSPQAHIAVAVVIIVAITIDVRAHCQYSTSPAVVVVAAVHIFIASMASPPLLLSPRMVPPAVDDAVRHSCQL